jgi:sarcosine oxidase, subunit alpha
VVDVLTPKFAGRTKILRVRAPLEMAARIAGVQVQDPRSTQPLDQAVEASGDEAIVCRCERITAAQVRALIRAGHYDLNEIKAVTRAGMGACRSKTCGALIHRMMREEGVPPEDVSDDTRRPLFIEIPLGIFAGEREA